MPLRIFDPAVDPDAAPARSDDVVARFRSGTTIQGRPMALEAWRVTTGDPEVADAIASAFGGEPQGWETKTEEVLEVFTNQASVDVIVEPGGIRSGMILWGRSAAIRKCDGVEQEDKSPCACPSDLKGRKEAASRGTGCEPNLQVYFRLKDLPDLGKMKFFSGSWSMAWEIGEAEDALEKIGGPAIGTLSLVQVEFQTKEGQTRRFTKPVLKITGPAPAEFGGPFA